MESYRLQQTSSGAIEIDRNGNGLDPLRPAGPVADPDEEVEPLSQMVAELNERPSSDRSTGSRSNGSTRS